MENLKRLTRSQSKAKKASKATNNIAPSVHYTYIKSLKVLLNVKKELWFENNKQKIIKL